MLDELYICADDRPPVTLRVLIAHATEVLRSSPAVYLILTALPDFARAAQALLDALDEDVTDLHRAAQEFAVTCLRAARHRRPGQDKQATTRARDRLEEVRQARENQRALTELRRKTAQRKAQPAPAPSMPLLLEVP